MNNELAGEIPTAVKKWTPYPGYKDSGIEWLHNVPSHWRIEKLKFNSYIKGRIGWQNLRADEFVDNGPYLITGMHFENSSVNRDVCYHITEERYELAAEIHIREGDVIVTKDGSIGKVAHIVDLPGKASLNSHLLLIRPTNKQYCPRYLYYFLGSSAFREYILISQSGTTFFGITQEAVVNFPILLPSLPEQNCIAAFLDRETAKIDALVAKKERLIALLQEKRAAVITCTVTKGLDSNVPMKDSGVEWLGLIPPRWKVRKVKEVSKLQTGLTLGKKYEGERLTLRPYLRVANVQDGYLDLEEITEVEVPASDVWRHELQHGDVLMTEGGDFDKLGRGYVWEGQIPGCLHQNHIFAVRPTKGLLDSHFLTLVMNSHYGRAYFTATSKQSTTWLRRTAQSSVISLSLFPTS